jgi:competence protein ComEA
MRPIRIHPALVALALAVGLLVPEAAPAQTQKTVNINAASAAQIALLPRIGTKVAERVVAYRSANGPFKRIEDLMEVKGIGEKQFGRLKPYLTLSGTTTLAEKVKSTGMRGGRSRKTAATPARSTPPSAPDGQ